MPTESNSNPEASLYKPWLNELSNEYKIVQDKLDKIGAFRFTIRGWSVTLVLASAVGSTTLRLPSAWILLALIPVVIAFATMEWAQDRNGRILGKRAVRLEKHIWRLLRKTSAASGDHEPFSMVPRIAHDFGDARVRSWRLVDLLSSHGGWLFYSFQIMLILATIWWLNSAWAPEALQLRSRDQAATVRNNGPAQPGAAPLNRPTTPEQDLNRPRNVKEKDTK